MFLFIYFPVVFCLNSFFIIFQEELSKHNNKGEISQSIQKIPSHMSWKDDIYSQVKGSEKREHVCCIGNIPKPKKPKVSLSKNQELKDELKKM